MTLNNEIIRRDGLSVETYLKEFLDFLWVRTGFNFHLFTSPAHLQQLMDEMAFNRVPLAVWNGLMTSALRIANMSQSIHHGLCHFGAFFIDVLVWLCSKLARMGIFRIAIFLFTWFLNPIVRGAIVVIYYAIDWFLEPLWNQLSEFIQKRLITAPYYNHFSTMG